MALMGRLERITSAVMRHVLKHWGVGIVCAVAYFDPGNWAVDLQAGSQYGYRLLFVVLLSGIFAVFLQILASRLGCVTGLDLATHCRLLLHSRPKHTLLYRWLGLYPLYLLSEVAIIATDLAELLGSAVALNMLFPKLQIWHGVLITAADVFILLAFRDPLRGRPVRAFELIIALLVLTVLICMAAIIPKLGVKWDDAFSGYLPSKYIFSSGALYTSVGIIGATVMPHGLFLGSALATQDRLSCLPSPTETDVKSDSMEAFKPSMAISRRAISSLKDSMASLLRVPPPSEYSTTANTYAEHENRPYQFVKAHIYHGAVDLVISLMFIAVSVNSMILITAGAVFFYGPDSSEWRQDGASLFDAFNFMRDTVGKWAAVLFGVALLAAGQSASIIATVSGQAVAEGFLRWRISAVARRVITRLIAIIPSTIVAVVAGRAGIDTLLVASQVVLSIVLPFLVVPLVYLTSSKSVMSVRKSSSQSSAPEPAFPLSIENGQKDELVDFSNSKTVATVGSVICLVIIVANVYVIISLGLGNI